MPTVTKKPKWHQPLAEQVGKRESRPRERQKQKKPTKVTNTVVEISFLLLTSLPRMFYWIKEEHSILIKISPTRVNDKTHNQYCLYLHHHGENWCFFHPVKIKSLRAVIEWHLLLFIFPFLASESCAFFRRSNLKCRLGPSSLRKLPRMLLTSSNNNNNPGDLAGLPDLSVPHLQLQSISLRCHGLDKAKRPFSSAPLAVIAH